MQELPPLRHPPLGHDIHLWQALELELHSTQDGPEGRTTLAQLTHPPHPAVTCPSYNYLL